MERRTGTIQTTGTGLVPPVPGIIITAGVAGSDPVIATVRRIGVIATNPDPAAPNPFMMAGYPDGCAVRTRPGTFDNERGRRSAHANGDIGGGRSLPSADRQEDEGRTS